MDTALQKYIRKFSKLRQGVTKFGPAPHKPVLLLAVLRGVEEDWIIDNRIDLSPELVGTFRSVWNALVTTDHSPLIAQPFFHMRGEKFWHHVSNPEFENWGTVTKSCNSLGVLHKVIDCAQLDPDLWALITHSESRSILRQTLLQTYFPSALDDLSESISYWDQVTHKVMEKSSNDYVAEIQSLQETLDLESFEEEVFVRGGVFKRQVPLVYNNACCISGLQIETSVSASLLDACHIVPFSNSHDDTISNGLALCPTLHRAFDRGLIAIEPDHYTVIVSNRLSEPVQSVYSIRQFQGQQINRPADERWWPGRENLVSHLKRFADNF